MIDSTARALAIKALKKKEESDQLSDKSMSVETIQMLQNFRIYMGNFFRYSLYKADKRADGVNATFKVLDALDSLIDGSYPPEEQVSLTSVAFKSQEIPLPDGSYPSYDYPQDVVDKGIQNLALLQAKLDECASNGGGVVKLDKGEYPLYPGLNINNCTLDLNGSVIYSVKYKNSGSLITMEGENPTIMNGEICGSYDTAYEVDSTFFESERLISPKGYSYHYALIQNMDIHNCWGYAVCETGGEDLISVSQKYLNPPVDAGYDDRGYRQHIVTLDTLNPPEGTFVREFISNFNNYKYICATAGVGYVRIISDDKIRFRFYDKDGVLLKTAYEFPLVPVEKPNNCTKFDITVYAKYAIYPNNNTEFQNYVIKLTNMPCGYFTVRGCTIHNNSSLGHAGGSGYLMCYDIDSYENFKVRHSAEDNPRGTNGTTGFLDIEDVPTPFLYMENCHSHDEKCLAMDGAYVSQFINCSGGISAYRGWTMDVLNHVGKVSSFSSSTLKKITANNIDMRGARGIYSTKVNPSLIDTSNVKSDIFDYLSYYNDFECHANYSITTYNWNRDDVAPNGTLYVTNAQSDGFRLNLKVADVNPYTGEKSHLVYRQTLADGYSSSGGAFSTITGDCYNIDSNVIFIPNGYNLTNCTFDLRYDTTIYAASSDAISSKLSGSYNNCIFNCYVSPYRTRNTFNITTPINLTFNDCEINLYGVPLLQARKFEIEPNIVFNNCIINGRRSSEYTAEELLNLIRGVY